MKQIKLLIGLPGSNIQTLGTQLTKEGYCFFHNADFEKENINLYLRQFQNFELLCISSNQFLDNISLNKATEIMTKEFPSVLFDYVYFENNPTKCIRNLEYRFHGDEKMNFDYIHELSKKYHIPQDVTYININLIEENR